MACLALCVCFSYPISRILFQSYSVNCRARLPESLLNAAAIQEHILFSRVAMVVTENLVNMKQERAYAFGQ